LNFENLVKYDAITSQCRNVVKLNKDIIIIQSY